MQVGGLVEHFFEERGEQRVVDQRSSKADALVEAHEMRAGVAVHAPPARFEDCAEVGAGRSLAVGARDMEGARQLELRVAEARAKFGDALQPEDVAARRQGGEAIELGLDRGVGAVGVVGHGRSSIRGKQHPHHPSCRA